LGVDVIDNTFGAIVFTEMGRVGGAMTSGVATEALDAKSEVLDLASKVLEQRSEALNLTPKVLKQRSKSLDIRSDKLAQRSIILEATSKELDTSTIRVLKQPYPSSSIGCPSSRV
jgi:hypothetical protein